MSKKILTHPVSDDQLRRELIRFAAVEIQVSGSLEGTRVVRFVLTAIYFWRENLYPEARLRFTAPRARARAITRGVGKDSPVVFRWSSQTLIAVLSSLIASVSEDASPDKPGISSHSATYSPSSFDQKTRYE